MKRELGYVIASVISAWMLLAPAMARATPTYTVNSTLDQVDDNPGNGVCHTAAGKCTLRAAIMEANRTTSGSEEVSIGVPPGTYTLTLAPNGANGDDSGALKLTAAGNSITINISGAGTANTIIDANHIDRVLVVTAGRQAKLSGVSLRNGDAHNSSDGGGVITAGSLALTDCVISHNTAQNGGGIRSVGYLSLTRVTLSDNQAASVGGGIFSSGYLRVSASTLNANHAVSGAGMGINITTPDTGMVDATRFTNNVAAMSGGAIYIGNSMLLTLDHSTLSGNQASTGGAVYVYPGATLDLRRSTISGNTASAGGGVFNSAGTLYASNSTISENSATGDGGGIFNQGTGTLFNSTVVFNEADADVDEVGGGAGIYNQGSNAFNVRNSILAGNIIPGDGGYEEDCRGALNAYGNNRFSYTTGAFYSNCQPTQVGVGTPSNINSYAELGPLQNNGGPTLTYALVPPSNMIDGAEASVGCIDQDGTLTTDQRDRLRSVDVICDIGAFEYDDLVFKDGFEHFEP
ncbi:MAG TPA: choice-of-anchor Q domain-containing protein [Rudaea sp.]|nr:choice-of-anchor Q domain-containing protein [Rudaea sp.]